MGWVKERKPLGTTSEYSSTVVQSAPLSLSYTNTAQQRYAPRQVTLLLSVGDDKCTIRVFTEEVGLVSGRTKEGGEGGEGGGGGGGG